MADDRIEATPEQVDAMRRMADRYGIKWNRADNFDTLAPKLLERLGKTRLDPDTYKRMQEHLVASAAPATPAEPLTPEQTALQDRLSESKRIAAQKGQQPGPLGGSGTRQKSVERLAKLTAAISRDAVTHGLPTDTTKKPVRPMGGAMIDALEGLGGGVIRNFVNAYEGGRDLARGAYNWTADKLGADVDNTPYPQSSLRYGLDEMREQHPALHMAGQVLGAAPLAYYAPASLLGQSLLGAATGAAISDPNERSQNAMIGGVVPFGVAGASGVGRWAAPRVGRAMTRAASPITSRISAGASKLANAFRSPDYGEAFDAAGTLVDDASPAAWHVAPYDVPPQFPNGLAPEYASGSLDEFGGIDWVPTPEDWARDLAWEAQMSGHPASDTAARMRQLYPHPNVENVIRPLNPPTPDFLVDPFTPQPFQPWVPHYLEPDPAAQPLLTDYTDTVFTTGPRPQLGSPRRLLPAPRQKLLPAPKE